MKTKLSNRTVLAAAVALALMSVAPVVTFAQGRPNI